MRIPSWFYSDPHFFHHNIIRYCERPYANVQEMNKNLIEKFNAKVGINDDVIFVGDMFLFEGPSPKRGATASDSQLTT